MELSFLLLLAWRGRGYHVPAMIVEFLGPPGSGKTTLYEGIAAGFSGRSISAEEVNPYRLGLLGIPHRQKGKLINKNFQRALRLSVMYREKDPAEAWLVEKGVSSLLYAIYVRDKRLLTKLAFRCVEQPTHLVVLLRAGIKRWEKDNEEEAAHGFDAKIRPFHDLYVKRMEERGVKLLVLDAFSEVEEDLSRIRAFIDEG